jgi:hypothetical protein
MRAPVRRAVLLAAFFVVAGGLTACGTSEECSATTICSESVDTCCNESSCYYEYSGTRVNCNGTDCSAAANRVAASVCAGVADPNASQKLSFAAAEVVTSRSACGPLR